MGLFWYDCVAHYTFGETTPQTPLWIHEVHLPVYAPNQEAAVQRAELAFYTDITARGHDEWGLEVEQKPRRMRHAPSKTTLSNAFPALEEIESDKKGIWHDRTVSRQKVLLPPLR